jgi:hypothetical protein
MVIIQKEKQETLSPGLQNLTTLARMTDDKKQRHYQRPYPSKSRASHHDNSHSFHVEARVLGREVPVCYTIMLLRRLAALSVLGAMLLLEVALLSIPAGRILELMLLERFKPVAREDDEFCLRLAAELGRGGGALDVGFNREVSSGPGLSLVEFSMAASEAEDCIECLLLSKLVVLFRFDVLASCSCGSSMGEDTGGSKILRRSTAFSNSSP